MRLLETRAALGAVAQAANYLTAAFSAENT
jgi:hypothetical protein